MLPQTMRTIALNAAFRAGGINFNARLARFAGQHAYVNDSTLELYPVSPVNVDLTLIGAPLVPRNVSYVNEGGASLAFENRHWRNG
jgi:hypothetical protein